ncbi:MAG: LLM class flavin-dependent oxidoreductase, partial [Pseudomonadales bacterium]|nr:LLM class flavin-dependent oxidoreductase [Pseudomonadales bacterium]
QQPLPLLIGGGGEKVTLKITAKHADEWNHWGDPATMAQKGAVLDAHCAAVGRDPKEIQRTAAILLFTGRTKAEADARWAAYSGGNEPPTSPGRTIVGSPAELRDVVAEYEEVGVEDATLGEHAEKFEAMDLLTQDVAGR